jgi:hypothetical protein
VTSKPVADGDDVAVAAPGALASVLVVPVFREQAENKNAPAAKSGSIVEVIRFFISVFHLLFLLRLLRLLATGRGKTAVIGYSFTRGGRRYGAAFIHKFTGV